MARSLAVSVVSQRATTLRNKLVSALVDVPSSRCAWEVISQANATNHRVRKGELTMSEKAASRTSMHSIVPRPVLFWVLVGHWEGTPFPIMRRQTPPHFSVWSVTDREHWEELRSEKYYTRRSKSRPVAKVDREFQRQTGKDVWEE